MLFSSLKVKFLVHCFLGWVENPIKKTCLLFVSASITWNDAKEECESRNSALAVFDSDDSMEWLFNYRQSTTGKLADFEDIAIPSHTKCDSTVNQFSSFCFISPF